MTQKKSGWILLEILVATTLSMLILPTLFQSYFTTQNYAKNMMTRFTTLAEQRYIEQFLRSDLLDTIKIISLSEDTLQTLNNNNNTITYALYKNRLNRKKNNGNRFYLHDTLSFSQLLITQPSPQSLNITLVSETEIYSYYIYLPNLSI